MTNQTKIFAVEDVLAKMKEAKNIALIDYQGLTAEQIRKLRREVRLAGGQIQVIKNSLISRALSLLGVSLDTPLTGPTALIFANDDEITPLAIVAKMTKELEKPKFKLGVYQNKILAAEEVERFVKLPPREALLAQFVGGLANPLSRLIYALKFNQIKLLLILKEVSKKNG